MTDQEALAEIRRGLDKQENYRRFDVEDEAFAYLELRLGMLRAREEEEADPACAYCGVRESSHDRDDAACMVFTTGPL